VLYAVGDLHQALAADATSLAGRRHADVHHIGAVEERLPRLRIQELVVQSKGNRHAIRVCKRLARTAARFVSFALSGLPLAAQRPGHKVTQRKDGVELLQRARISTSGVSEH
jgi:hypothetical protein